MNIFVGNLAFSATDHDLRQLFEPFGAVDKVNIITDRDTGRSRGFGFVECSSVAERYDNFTRNYRYNVVAHIPLEQPDETPDTLSAR